VNEHVTAKPGHEFAVPETHQKAGTMPTNSVPQLLTIEQLAEQLTTSIRHIRRLIAERRVPYVKVGGLIRFDPAEITTWLDASRRPLEQAERPSGHSAIRRVS
jgi:excisionase family DNA binding protein